MTRPEVWTEHGGEGRLGAMLCNGMTNVSKGENRKGEKLIFLTSIHSHKVTFYIILINFY